MKRLFAISACLLALLGCGPELEYSTPMTEVGRVSKLIFVPSGHGSDVAIGISSKGDPAVVPVDIDIPARYGIVFECDHGSFAIEGEKWADLWKSLKEGDEVLIQYREVYEVDLTKPKSERRFKKLDFLGAVKNKRFADKSSL